MSLGSELRRIREDCGLTLKEVSSEIGVTIDHLSKIENDYRKPSLTHINRLSELYELPDLVDYYYEEEITKLTDDHPDTQKLLEKIVKRMKNPDRNPFNLDSPKSKWGKSPDLNDVRRYVKGGRFGKVKGFDYYPNENGKLTKKQRETILNDSRNWMGQDEIDSGMSDEEIIGYWNDFYDQNGHSIPEFKKKWEREFIRGYEREGKSLGKEPTEITESSEIKDLKKRLSSILNKKPSLDDDGLG